MERKQNAYVTKKGKRYQVRHGGTGQLLKSFGSKAKADEHMRALHKKHKPASRSRGVRAKRRVEARRNNPDRLSLFQRNLKKGDRVWWSDPGEGFSSGVYTVDEVYDEDGERFSDTMVTLFNKAGSTPEVNLDELRAVPKGKRQKNPSIPEGMTEHDMARMLTVA